MRGGNKLIRLSNYILFDLWEDKDREDGGPVGARENS